MFDIVLTREHIAAYQKFLCEEERAAATVQKYMQTLQSFLNWLNGRAVSKETAAQWKTHLLNQRQAPATINAKLSAVNGLFRFLGWENCRLRFLKLQRRTFQDTSRELSKHDYFQLLNAASHQNDSQLFLLMETICSTGIRVSETRCITVEAARSGCAEIRLKGKIRTILLPAKLRRKLLKFAKKRKIASGELFLSKDGKPLSRFQIWRAMKKLSLESGVPASKVFPHNLRHLFARTFYQTVRDIVKLSDVLGHSSIETTRIYLRTTSAEHSRQLNRLGLIC